MTARTAAAAALNCFEWLQRPENVLTGQITWPDYRRASRRSAPPARRLGADLDVRSYFDSIDWELMLKAVRHHTDCPWCGSTSNAG